MDKRVFKTILILTIWIACGLLAYIVKDPDTFYYAALGTLIVSFVL